jgi:hypothetical protein
LGKAQKRRCVKATASNAVSSRRSHLLFTLHFKTSSKSGVSREGKLNICDSAGSERLSKSSTSANDNAYVGGALLKETKHINCFFLEHPSLFLMWLIEKLQAGDSNVPFRESKYPNSLGGNSKTLLHSFAVASHFHESMCSLLFGLLKRSTRWISRPRPLSVVGVEDLWELFKI